MRISLTLFLLIHAIFAVADTWSPAKMIAIISENGNYVVKIFPGESLGEVYGFHGEKIGQRAVAEYFRYKNDVFVKYGEFTLLNPISPVIVALANNGNLITLDNWHNVGIGHVIALYNPKGNVIVRYKLDDLYTNSTLDKMKMTISSIWWRCREIAPFFSSQNRTYIIYDFAGNVIEIDTKTGEFRIRNETARCSS